MTHKQGRGLIDLVVYLLIGYFLGALIGAVVFLVFIHEETFGSGNSRFVYTWFNFGGLIGALLAVALWFRKRRHETPPP